MNTITYTKKSLTVFFALIIALSAAVEAGICLGGPEWLYPVLMWLPAVSALAPFLHAAHNNYDQSVFSVITRGDNAPFFVGETSVLTIMCVWVIAIIMYFSAKKAKNV